MGAIGEYVHLYWKNYVAHGVGRNSGSKKMVTLDQYRSKLLSKIKSFSQKANLEQIENQLNTNAEYISRMLMDASNATKGDFVQGALSAANLNNLFDEPYIYNYLMQKININESGTAVSIGNIPKLPNVAIKIPKISSTAGNTKITTIKAKIDSFDSYIPSIQTEIKKLQQGGIDQSFFTTVVSKFKKFKTDFDTIVNTISKSKTAISKLKGLNIIGNDSLDSQGTQYVYSQLRKFQATFNLAGYLMKINKGISEVIAQPAGACISGGIADMSNQWVRDQFRKTIGKNKRHETRSTTKLVSVSTWYLDTQVKKTMSSQRYNAIIDKDANGNTLGLKIEYQNLPTQQKADFELSLTTGNVGVSMKNVDLSKTLVKIKGKNVPTTISLQTTSLLYYLIGMEQEFEDLGNHVLNALVEHTQRADNLAGYVQQRQAGNELLFLWVLYSAASGRLQGVNGGEADILAIQHEEKGISKISLIDISILISNLVDIGPGIWDSATSGMYSSIRSIVVNNKRKRGYTSAKGRNIKDIQARITQIIVDVRMKKIKAVLTKSYVNSIINN